MDRIKDTLKENIHLSRLELALGLAVCGLAGMVLGMLIVPPRDLAIGCGNNINAVPSPEEALDTANDQTGE
jgi:hypothetical protein